MLISDKMKRRVVQVLRCLVVLGWLSSTSKMTWTNVCVNLIERGCGYRITMMNDEADENIERQ